MGRRKGPRLQWFPVLGTPQGENSDYSTFPAYREFALFPAFNTVDTEVLDLTFDEPTEEAFDAGGGLPSLADFQQSAWRLRRCVGKLFVWQEPITDTETDVADVPDVLITAGLIVLHVDEGSGAPLSVAGTYDPMLAVNARDPWIWRRSWLLSCGSIQARTAGGTADVSQGNPFPSSNINFASALDGPHVDAKTNRIIGAEERLFVVINARQRFNEDTGVDAIISGLFDYRLLGTTMKQTNRRNASR